MTNLEKTLHRMQDLQKEKERDTELMRYTKRGDIDGLDVCIRQLRVDLNLPEQEEEEEEEEVDPRIERVLSEEDEDGFSPLSVAAANSDVNLIDFLVEAGLSSFFYFYFILFYFIYFFFIFIFIFFFFLFSFFFYLFGIFV